MNKSRSPDATGVPAAASVSIEHLSHTYPGASVAALDDVSLQVAPGARLGLLGPNGAGKSTLMRILCGYLPPGTDSGMRVSVNGFDVRTDSLSVRAQVGYMPEHVPLYPELRVREHLAFRASIKRVPRRGAAAEVERVGAMTGLTDRLAQPISQLSRGYRQRVGIADALLGSPGLLVLDEPTVGLDPNQVQDIRAMLRELGSEQTLIFSSHILAEVEALCDRVAILSRGSLVVDATLDEALAAGVVEASFRGSKADVEGVLAAIEAGDAASPSAAVREESGLAHATIEVPLESRAQPEQFMQTIGEAALAHGLVVARLELSKTRLEQRFAEVTGTTRHADSDDERAL